MKGVTPILRPSAGQHSPLRRQGDRPRRQRRRAGRRVAHKPQVWPGPTIGRRRTRIRFHRLPCVRELANDNFRTTLLNGVAWVSGLEMPADGVPSTTLSKAELERLMDECRRSFTRRRSRKVICPDGGAAVHRARLELVSTAGPVAGSGFPGLDVLSFPGCWSSGRSPFWAARGRSLEVDLSRRRNGTEAVPYKAEL